MLGRNFQTKTCFHLQDIFTSVKKSPKKFMKIDKPPVCQKPLQSGKKYRLMSEPEADITPEVCAPKASPAVAVGCILLSYGISRVSIESILFSYFISYSYENSCFTHLVACSKDAVEFKD